MSGSQVPPPPTEPAHPLETKTYRFRADGTRPVLQIELTSGKAGGDSKEATEKLTIELHSPVSGEIFEARTSIGRIEVDRDGRVMYFCTAGENVGFTLFVGRSVTVSMSRSTGDVLVQTPSKILSVARESPKDDGLGNAPPKDMVRIRLE
ncbi:MAG: hypothetical protein JRN57_01080 [Nitrososphaerota archaeon]|nr:hypothetical protein [Nitrososphaerota archaeon]MDG7010688.1 hypothetical protein [Nitrososphaerota archaeon]